jgi:hypothetical protein
MKRVATAFLLAALPCLAQVADEPTISADAALDALNARSGSAVRTDRR